MIPDADTVAKFHAAVTLGHRTPRAMGRGYGAVAHELRVRWAKRTGRRTAKCGQCGRFKSRPSTPCDHCGDVPYTYLAGDDRLARLDHDAANGWEN